MSHHALVVLAPGCEELEAVASIDTLVRGGIQVTAASICPQGRLQITASRGVKLVADVLLESVAEQHFDLILLPGGLPGAEYLRDNPLLIRMLKEQRARGGWRAAICASPALVLAHHDLIGPAKVTGYILREAQPLGLHMPLHQQLYDAISRRSPVASGLSSFSI